MTIQRRLLDLANRVLRAANLRIDSRTALLKESNRINRLSATGWFSQRSYPIPPCFETARYHFVLDALLEVRSDIEKLRTPALNDVDYTFDNGFYSSPDAEVLYALVRKLHPKRILEIGCGNSTRVSRQAIIDGSLIAELTCIDPAPRRDVLRFADKSELLPVEESDAELLVSKLEPGDVLFIDTSHEVRPGNDCAFIYGRLVPSVPVGVFVHIHDIFLPWEYPEDFVRTEAPLWGEQYIVSAMLHGCGTWEAVWPGYYLQRTLPNFRQLFPHSEERNAQSLWLRRN